MYKNARPLFLSIVIACGALLAALLPAATPLRAQGVSILNARWEGNDYVIRFSDSLNYTVDLGASDSMLVLYFSRPITVIETETKGPNDIFASFSRNAGDSMVVLTVRGKNRVEYSTLWRPYSHRLIVHTFNSKDLEANYAANQYHLGLLALEQHLPEQATGYLSGARASDNGDIARRAASILGVTYAQEGQDSLARIYLAAPYDADDYMARAELNRRAGDMEAAEKDEEMFRQKIAEMDEKMGEFVEANPAAPVGNESAEAVESDRPPIAKIFDDWRGIVLVGVAALLIIALAVWFSRRPASPAQTVTDGTARPDNRNAEPIQPPAQTVRTATTPPPPPAPTPAPPPSPEPASEPNAATASQTIPVVPAEEPIAEAKKEENVVAAAATPEAVVADRETTSETTAATDSESDKPAMEEEKPTATAAQRSSAQADQLRQRMEAARGGVSQSQSAKPAARVESVGTESTLTEARRLNVSRDYVELRNRIAELRKRIEES